MRARIVLPLLLVILAVLFAVAMLFPRGGEKLVARAMTKVSSEPLRDCLATGLGLNVPWQGTAPAMHADRFGLRVVVGDNGHDRQVGLFTDGGQPLSSSQSAALQACLALKD
ncbi:hypothetical protein [Novosphingobium sp.]|uniref:hypothetical protein n=1 Tax=Novosphingobium sp. TaxID=1874826 RepID=UPI0033425FE2